MTYGADERIDAYIVALPDWQQAICRQVRDLVHAADPEVSETIKRSKQPYFVAPGQHLRTARGQGSRQRVPLRRRYRP